MLLPSKNLLPFDGELYLLDDFLDKSQLASILSCLPKLNWKQYPITLFGKSYLQPREIAFYGETRVTYTYSRNTRLNALKWPSEIAALKSIMEELCESSFNSVLCNHYRNEKDSMGMHADNESSLGENPCIASMSFGGTRILRVTHNESKQSLKIPLKNNSLLIMKGSMQHHWKHGIPKESKEMEARYNLTFRAIKKEA